MLDLRIVLWTVFCLLVVKSDEVNYRRGQREPEGRITYPNDFLIGRRHYDNYYPPGYYGGREFSSKFQHNPQYDAEIEYSESNHYGWQEPDGKHGHDNSSKQIPLDFIQNINQYNVSDLLLNFVEDEMEYDEPLVIRTRFGEEESERNAAVLPKAAGCAPELITVPLATSDDPSVLYIPQCTRVERCGGCCSHNLLSCQPKETETLTYQVLKTQYTGAKKLKMLAKEVVVIEKHTKCKCDCKIKEEHCNKYQEYRPSECRCDCTNTDEEKKCYKDESKKLWDTELCACQCREVLQCSTGYYFDQIECRCMPEPMKRRFANRERRGYVREVLAVSPLDQEE